MIKVRCDLCGSDSHTLKHEVEMTEDNPRFYRYARNVPQKERMTGVFSLVVCDSCGLMFVNPRFETEELELAYSSHEVVGGNWQNFPYLFDRRLPDEMQRRSPSKVRGAGASDWKLEIIRRYLPESGDRQPRLLDLGCGNGSFVYDALQGGFDAYGIDLNPDRVAQGRDLYGLDEARLLCVNVDDFMVEEKFDVVTMWDVIEHVESPSSLLKRLGALMHTDSRLFALTMSTDSITYRMFGKNWHYVHPAQHLHYFSHETLKQMYEANGFDLVGVELDYSRTKNLGHLLYRVLMGRMNRFCFHLYARKSPLRFLFRPLQGGMSDERMQKRLENLHPGAYVGRYHDNFVFVGRSKPGDAAP